MGVVRRAQSDLKQQVRMNLRYEIDWNELLVMKLTGYDPPLIERGLENFAVVYFLGAELF